MERRNQPVEMPLEVIPSEDLGKDQIKANIAKEAKNFANSVSLVGLTHATNEKNPKVRRIIWLIWLLFGMGLAVYQVQDRVCYFYSHPYNTEFKMVADKELRFPQVTICKEDWMSRTKAGKNGSGEFFYLLERLENMLIDGNFTFDEYIKVYIEFLQSLENETQDWDALSRNISFSWNELVTNISWNGMENRSLFQEIDTDLGHCITIGSDSNPLTATRPGLRSGLQLQLDAMEEDSVFIVTDDRDIFTGFRFLIHDPAEEPRMLEAGFVVSPGYVAQVAVTLEKVAQLGPPYSDCYDNSTYRIINCRLCCEFDFYEKKCKCIPFKHYNTTGKKVCTYVEKRYCDILFQESLAENSSCNCSQQCHGLIYDYSISQSMISKKLLNLLETGSVDAASSGDEHDILVVNIYYPSLMYQDISSNKSYAFTQLLSDIGGALSLLLGATLLTIYEVAEFLTIITTNFVFSRLRKKTYSLRRPSDFT